MNWTVFRGTKMLQELSTHTLKCKQTQMTTLRKVRNCNSVLRKNIQKEKIQACAFCIFSFFQWFLQKFCLASGFCSPWERTACNLFSFVLRPCCLHSPHCGLCSLQLEDYPDFQGSLYFKSQLNFNSEKRSLYFLQKEP